MVSPLLLPSRYQKTRTSLYVRLYCSYEAHSDITYRLSPDPCDLDDDTVRSLLKTPETLAWDGYLMEIASSMCSTSTAHKITPNLIVKRKDSVECATMDYIRVNTRIPVPQPRYPHLSSWLVMDFIDGRILIKCWDSLSFWMQLRVACTLRGYVKQLRRLKGTCPGSITNGMIRDHSLFDDKLLGPYPSSTAFQAFCELVAHQA